MWVMLVRPELKPLDSAIPRPAPYAAFAVQFESMAYGCLVVDRSWPILSRTGNRLGIKQDMEHALKNFPSNRVVTNERTRMKLKVPSRH